MNNVLGTFILVGGGLIYLYGAILCFFGADQEGNRKTRLPAELRRWNGWANLLIALFFFCEALLSFRQLEEFFFPFARHMFVQTIAFLMLVGGLALKLRYFLLRQQQTPQNFERAPKQRVEYYDVTGNPDETAMANRPAAMVRALERLGFHPLFMSKAVAWLAGGQGHLSEVCEIFSSPDGRAFAEPESFLSRETIALRSLLSDGSIVDTTLLVDGERASNFFERLTVRGNWPRTNRPGAGYYFERLEDAQVEALWARHSERLEQIVRQRGTLIPSQAGFERYVELCRRGLKISSGGKMLDNLVLLFSVFLIAFFLTPVVAVLRELGDFGSTMLAVVALLAVLAFWGSVKLSRHLPLPFVLGADQFFSVLSPFM